MTNIESPNLAAQRAYVKRKKDEGFKFGLTVGDAFIRGIRDLGYKSNGTALSELVDNSIQAGADRVDVVFGYEATKSEKKPSEIAVIDNGHGMEADMVRMAVLWGGTHREGDRAGMGRYGYGLPSAAVSMGTRFTVYSKAKDSDIHAASIDLQEISAGKYDQDGEIIVPPARKAKLPAFAQNAIEAAYPEGWESGTVVVIEKLDRLDQTTAGGLRENLFRHFGVTYHKVMNAVSIYVDGTYVEPIDPLFLTPGYRFYDLDEDKAVAFDPLVIVVKDPNTRQEVGTVNVRMCYLPPTFASIDKKKAAAKKNANPRFNIMKEYHGVIFSRMGRLIDVKARTPWTTFINNDRYIKVEVEFPAVLDEEFGITTSKQQVTVSERIWDILQQNGLPKAIEQLRHQVSEAKTKLKEALEAPPPGEERPSESAMASAKSHLRPASPEVKARQKARGDDRLEKAAADAAREAGTDVETEKQKLILEHSGRDFKIEIETVHSGPFFRCDFFHTTKVLYLNRAHRFYQDLYDGPRSSVEVRAALEVLLLAIGDSMLDAPPETQRVYKVEVPQWSLKLDLALEDLADSVGLAEDRDAEEKAWEPEAAE